MDKAPADFPNSTDQSTVQFLGGIDISKREDCHKFISSIPGRLDGMVNCAGIARQEGKIASDDLWARTLAVNLTGTVCYLSTISFPWGIMLYFLEDAADEPSPVEHVH